MMADLFDTVMVKPSKEDRESDAYSWEQWHDIGNIVSGNGYM